LNLDHGVEDVQHGAFVHKLEVVHDVDSEVVQNFVPAFHKRSAVGVRQVVHKPCLFRDAHLSHEFFVVEHTAAELCDKLATEALLNTRVLHQNLHYL